MFLGRRKKQGHAKELAGVFERQMANRERAQARVARLKCKTIRPLTPPRINKNRIARWLSDVRIAWRIPQPPANENKSPFSSGWNFCDKLVKKGFKCIGSGAHSSVYAKDGYNRVIKVGKSGDAWMNYVLWGRKKGYEGKYVPRVFSYKWFNGAHDFYVAVVERFERTTSRGHGGKDLDPILLDLFSHGHRGNEYALLAMDALVPGLDKFTLDLRQAANDNGWSMDVHAGNFMVRKDGSWVATDPVNDHTNPIKERIRHIRELSQQPIAA